MRRVVLLGTGRALPERVLTNDELAQRVATSDEWIQTRTGIRCRRVAAPGQAASDLAAEAGRRACAAAGIDPQEIDCILCATVTPDMPLPACAVLVQRKLGGRPGSPAFDLAAACGGFLYGLAVAEGLLRGGRYRRVLLCGVEVLSRFIDWEDRSTCILFGDGAGAAVLGLGEEDDPRGLLSVHLFADGRLADLLYIPAGGSLRPASHETVQGREHSVRMDGRAIFAHVVRDLSAACQTALQDCGLTLLDIDRVIPHQANRRLLEALAQRLGLPLERLYINIDRYGNTSAASVPIALDEALEQGWLQPGHTVLLCALGAGLAWGAACLRL
ncbi:MAG: beta-ketoacyl-ACP synthase III [Myxococcales bacterium]|nr:beta-ketoacyl-ACP synthase III [Myxococcales bacterium]